VSEHAAGAGPRVLYSFPHPLGSAGIGTTALWQVRGLVARGVAVTVWTTSLAVGPEGLGGAVHETLRVAGRRIPHRALGGDRALHLHDRLVARHLARHPDRYDLVHTWPSASLLTARAGRKVAVPVVREAPNTHTAHAYEVAERAHRDCELPVARGASHRFDRARLEREVAEYEAASVVLVPSDWVRDTFLDRGVEPGRLARHRYGYDPARFQPPVPDERGRPGRPFTALFLGSCEPRKGLHLALRAWLASGLAATGRLVVCGPFVPGYRERLRPWLSHPSVQVVPARAEVAPLLQAADVLVLPSLEEGSALVTYEAQGCGCALLVSDAAGAVVEHGANGLVHRAGDVTGLAEDLRAVAADPALAARLRAGATEAAGGLTWPAAAARLVEVYAGLLPLGCTP
jgi:glycosyltransferase involved in cell wall biosynthesis